MSSRRGEAMTGVRVHPLVVDAASGKLPSWEQASPPRRAHMKRVASLMEGWARGLGLPESEVLRWRAAAYLHDVLRDADWDDLRKQAPPAVRDLPGPLLHGPVASQRLWEEGVEDQEFLTAVAYHTVGYPELEAMGQALFVADFVEPGRREDREWRRQLRESMPEEWDRVTRVVTATRIHRILQREWPLRRETVGFWNRLVGQKAPGDQGGDPGPEDGR
jgi:HD superfamily phosphohydrolase YqeK